MKFCNFAQGGRLIVPRWSIRVSLTISCLWNSQSMCTLFCDDLKFLGWISTHITCPGLGIVQTGRICRFRRSNPKDEDLSLYEIVTPNAESGSQGSWFLFQAGWYVDKPIYVLHLSCPRTIRSWTVRRNYAAHHLTFEGSVDVRSVSSCLKMHFWITWRVAFMANDGVKRNEQLRLIPFRISFVIGHRGDVRL